MNIIRKLTLMLCVIAMSDVMAYEQNLTHRTMTRHAFNVASNSSRFLTRVGLSNESRAGGLLLAEVTANGARDEDDGSRPLNHFYDPLHESALVFTKWAPDGCYWLPVGDFTARQWATSTADNEFGLTNARMAFLRMLTSKTSASRDESTYQLFTTLGHLMHLVQDMAQPQHTRNDAHPTSDGDFVKKPLDWMKRRSRYEAWCRDNASALTYSGYPIVDFPTYSAYFAVNGGRGLAQYSNRNFVTEQTNYSDPECDPFHFVEPAETRAVPREELHTVTTTKYLPDGSGATIQVVAYTDTVLSFATSDSYTNSAEVNQNHSVYSLFDYDLGEAGKSPVYSLPPASLQSQADLLVPRAVGYSAGFLQHFFRGQIDVKWLRKSDGTYDVTVRNLSPDALADIHLTALYRVMPGTHGAGSGEDLVSVIDRDLESVVLGPGLSTVLTGITVPGLEGEETINGFERRIAIRATLGTEPNAVVGLVQPEVAGLRFQVDWAEGTLKSGFLDLLVEEQNDPSPKLWKNDRTFSLSSGCDGGLTLKQEIPDSTVSPLGSHPMVVEIKKSPAGSRYFWWVVLGGSSNCGGFAEPTSATMTISLDGTVVFQKTQTLFPKNVNFISGFYPK